MAFLTKWCILLLLITPTIARNPIVFFPYLNGKSIDDLRPELTTRQGLGNVLLFSSKYPDKAIGYKYSGYYRYKGYLVEGSKMDNHAFQFRVVPGLSGQFRSVSFQSRSDPTRYLRHKSHSVYLHQQDHTTGFNSSATWLERYATDGSSGRKYEVVSLPYHYLTASSSVLTIYKEHFNIGHQKSISWDLRSVDDSNVVWSRSNKKREIRVFSDGTLLYSRYYRLKALGASETSDALARLTDKNIGRFDTRFRIVRGLSGDSNAISVQSVEMENYFLTLIYKSGRNYFCLGRYEDEHTYKKMASFFPVPALDESQGISFLSVYLRDSYMCVNHDSIWLKKKEHSMKYSQECSWDLRVLDKSGNVWMTYWEDLQYSRKGPHVLGEEQGIPLGSDVVHRANEVLTANTLAWTSGLPNNATCTAEGKRCSMGLVCKKNRCQILDTASYNLPAETAPVSPRGNIGDVCDPNSEIKCVQGTKCTQADGIYFCLPSTNAESSNTARFFVQSSKQLKLNRRH